MKNLNMNLNLFKTFIAVYETKNFSKAAELLAISQPAVFRNNKELERQLEAKLFLSHTRGVEPTQDADVLYPYIVSGLGTLEKGIDVMTEAKSNIERIKIGCPSNLSGHLLMQYFNEFRENNKNIELDIHDSKDKHVDELSKHEIDIAIDLYLPTEAVFKTVTLCELPNTFFASKEFVNKNSLSTNIKKEQLCTLPMILYNTRRTVNSLFEKLQVKINPAYVVSTYEFMYQLVSGGYGIGYSHELLVDKNKEFEKLDLGGKLPDSILRCAYHELHITKTMRKFLNGLQEFCEQLNA